MKLTVRTTTCMMWSIFDDLQHNVSWCEMHWNVQNSRPPHTTYTFSLNFVATPVFFPMIDGALSVVILTAWDLSTLTLFSTPTRDENTTGCCGIRHRHQPQEFHSDKVSSIPRINMASYATSEMSMLSSSTTENVTNNLTLFFSWLSKFAKMFETVSATMFLVRLKISKNL